MKTLLYMALLPALLLSCGKPKENNDYEALKAQNDSLMRMKHDMQEQVDGYFSAMNRIEQNIAKIKDQQGLLSSRVSSAENTGDEQTRIEQDIESLNQLLKANKDELARLKNQIRKSEFHSAELERTLARLTRQLEEETAKVAALQGQVTERDSIIADLSIAIDTLKKNIDSKQAIIEEHEETIHTAWYVFGTRKELKKQNIITSGGLFSRKVLQSDFKKDYFVRIDARNTTSIPFYSSKAKVLTSHPKSSYTLDKEDDTYTLVIIDRQEFWSISKYLVVEVD